MTRISPSRVIQMVGDDRVVFVNDRTMAEHVELISNLPTIMPRWMLDAECGDNFGPAGIEFSADQVKAVMQALDYFIECSTVPLAEQLAGVQMFESQPGESFEDFAHRVGLL